MADVEGVVGGVAGGVAEGASGHGLAALPSATSRTLIALVIGQICLHSCMTGIRMAAPLQVLRQSHSAWMVGVLLGLFAAAPVLLALHAGRLADRHGYHRPLQVAVTLTVLGGAFALLAARLDPLPAAMWPGVSFSLLCVAALCTGAGANLGLIAIQRTAGRTARDATKLRRVFSWLGLAPALSNVVGPVLAGALIDLGGFRAAYAALMALPLLGLWWARRVPVPVPRPAGLRRSSSWDLLRAPGLRRLLLVNWLLSASWDVHTFVVPVLGHERHFSASAIGLVLGLFAAAVALVRLAIPLLAHRLSEAQVLVTTMLCTAAVFAVDPLVQSVWVMCGCAALLGLALGSVQPMIMTTLHQITPRRVTGLQPDLELDAGRVRIRLRRGGGISRWRDARSGVGCGGLGDGIAPFGDRRGGRREVVRRQARFARVAGRVEVRVPDGGREAAQRLRTDRQGRCVAPAGEALERFAVFRALHLLLGDRHAALAQQLARRFAGLAIADQHIQDDRVARHDLTQFERQGNIAAGRRAAGADGGHLGVAAGGCAVGVGHLAVRADDLVLGLCGRCGDQCDERCQRCKAPRLRGTRLRQGRGDEVWGHRISGCHWACGHCRNVTQEPNARVRGWNLTDPNEGFNRYARHRYARAACAAHPGRVGEATRPGAARGRETP